MNWPFREPRELGVFVCTRVFDRSAPIRSVWHDENGDWQFLCNDGHDHDQQSQARLVCLEDALALEPRLAELADMPAGYVAWRADSAAAWQRKPIGT